MTSSETEVWHLHSMEAAFQIQKLSVTNQAMDWSGIAVARCICAYILHLMCPVVAVYHRMASLP